MFQLITQPQATDLNPSRGIDAYRWMSMNPERRAAGDIAGYIAEVEGFAAKLAAVVTNDVQAAEAAAQVEMYRVKWIDWTNTLWAAKSRTASPMITGPAKFPVARNNKAMDAEHKKVGKFLEWVKSATPRAIKAVQMAGVVKPAPEKANESIIVNGVEIVTNYEIERIQMLFDGKPDPDTIARLKGAGWNWSPKNMAWQRMITAATMRSAQQIAAGPAPKPVPRPAFDGKTYRTMGREFTVTAAFDTDDEANAYLAGKPGEGVIGVDGGKVLIVAMIDKGVPA